MGEIGSYSNKSKNETITPEDITVISIHRRGAAELFRVRYAEKMITIAHKTNPINGTTDGTKIALVPRW
jgi:hypothetical protein